MAVERKDIVQAIGVFGGTAPVVRYGGNGYGDITRNGVGDYSIAMDPETFLAQRGSTVEAFPMRGSYAVLTAWAEGNIIRVLSYDPPTAAPKDCEVFGVLAERIAGNTDTALLPVVAPPAPVSVSIARSAYMPSADQGGLTGASVFMNLFGTTLYDDAADFNVDSVSQLSANRGGRYELSFWARLGIQVAGGADGVNTQVFVNAVSVPGGIDTQYFNSGALGENRTYTRQILIDINAGETLRVTTESMGNTYILGAGATYTMLVRADP